MFNFLVWCNFRDVEMCNNEHRIPIDPSLLFYLEMFWFHIWEFNFSKLPSVQVPRYFGLLRSSPFAIKSGLMTLFSLLNLLKLSWNLSIWQFVSALYDMTLFKLHLESQYIKQDLFIFGYYMYTICQNLCKHLANE
jgi:hypothetical protein